MPDRAIVAFEDDTTDAGLVAVGRAVDKVGIDAPFAFIVVVTVYAKLEPWLSSSSVYRVWILPPTRGLSVPKAMTTSML
jgi:hypothetical protein